MWTEPSGIARCAAKASPVQTSSETGVPSGDPAEHLAEDGPLAGTPLDELDVEEGVVHESMTTEAKNN